MAQAVNSKAFLGVGLAFPVQLDGTGQIALAAYEDDVQEAIRIILSTTPGERAMRPDFGAGLNALLFEPLSTMTMTLAQYYVQQALTTWEPRIDSLDVQVSSTSPGTLNIDISYRVRATNTFYNLVYPFYLMEGSST